MRCSSDPALRYIAHYLFIGCGIGSGTDQSRALCLKEAL